MENQHHHRGHNSQRSRRKTLSPSRVTAFLSSSLGEDDLGNHNENMPPVTSNGEGGDPVPLWSTTITERRKPCKSTKSHPSDLNKKTKASCLHSSVYMTWTKGGGGREAGSLWMDSSSSSSEGDAATDGQFWWAPHHNAAAGGGGGGLGFRDITNYQDHDDDEDDESWMMMDGDGRTTTTTRRRGEGGERMVMIRFETGKIVSASFVWLENQVPGLSVVLIGGEEEEEESVMFLDFQGSNGEEAAKQALVLLQARLRSSSSSSSSPPASTVKEEEEEAASSSASSSAPAAAEEEEAEEVMMTTNDVDELVRRFQKAKPHSKVAKALAQHVYRLTGYSLMSMGTINAAAAGVEPAPVTPQGPMVVEQMRAMVMNLEPIVRGMNDVHQREVKASEERTQARPERRKEDGFYRYWCIKTNVEITPQDYRSRYMASLPYYLQAASLHQQSHHDEAAAESSKTVGEVSEAKTPPSSPSPPSSAVHSKQQESPLLDFEGIDNDGERKKKDAEDDSGVTVHTMMKAEGEEGERAGPSSPSPEDVAALFDDDDVIEHEEDMVSNSFTAFTPPPHPSPVSAATATMMENDGVVAQGGSEEAAAPKVLLGNEEKEESPVPSFSSSSATAEEDSAEEVVSTTKSNDDDCYEPPPPRSSSNHHHKRKSSAIMVGIENVDPKDVEMIYREAEVKLHLAIDKALREYHHNVSVAHAALAASSRRKVVLGGRGEQATSDVDGENQVEG